MTSRVSAEPAPSVATQFRSWGAAARPHWRMDAVVLGVVAVVLRLPAFFATRSLVFDDGTFGASALAMRQGDLPFRDLFSSQGPVFLPLVWLADLVGFRTLDAPRLLSLASGVLVTIAVYSCGRRVTTRANALLAAGLVTTSGSVLWVTGPVNADGPSLALSVLAVALALRALDHAQPRLWDAVWVGLAGGAAASIKATSVPAVVAAGVVLLLVRRRLLDAALAAGVAVAVYLVTALPWGVGRVWDQSFTYHNEARRLNTGPEAAWRVLRTLWERDALVVTALALALLTFVVVRLTTSRRSGGSIAAAERAPAAPPLGVVVAVLVGWVVLVFALLVYEPSLFRSHVAHLVPPLALLASVRPAAWVVLAVGALVVAPFWAIENRTILWPHGYRGNEAAVVERLRQLPDGTRVITDDPGLSWRAGHALPGVLADPSFKRIENGQITTAVVAREARSADVCAVVVTSRQHFGSLPGLPAALAADGYRPERLGDIVLYRRGGRCRGS
jgi:4-amino-4-deoxy-L-arabinose transferase-like glycosyltransferase